MIILFLRKLITISETQNQILGKLFFRNLINGNSGYIIHNLAPYIIRVTLLIPE